MLAASLLVEDSQNGSVTRDYSRTLYLASLFESHSMRVFTLELLAVDFGNW